MAGVMLAQAPVADKRNTGIVDTDTHFKPIKYDTLREWEARKADLRRQILFAAGLDPMPEKTALNAQVFGRLEHEGYTIEKVCLETLPGFYLGGNLYRPSGGGKNLPAVAKPHGHWTYGRLENQPLNSTPTLAANLALQGYVVFAYDMVGYNDTVQTPHRFDGKAEQLWGLGPLGLQLWNSIRVVDFLESLPEVDKSRIGVTGASGGGTQTFLLGAVDDRIAFSAPVNMVSAIMQGGCVCENAPGLRIGTNNMDIAAMMAPRPQFIVSATGDWTKNVPKEEFPAVRDVYRLYGKADKVDCVQIDAPHNYNEASRTAVYRFLAKHVLGSAEADTIKEKRISVPPLQDMLVFHARPLPGNAVDFTQLFRWWREMSDNQYAATADVAVLRARLALALKAGWPDQVDTTVDGENVVLFRSGAGDRIPGVFLPGNGQPVLIVHPDGIEAARKSAEAGRYINEKRPVLLIDAFQTGSAVAERNLDVKHFTTFNRTDSANRVQDILTAAAFLSHQISDGVEIVGLGDAAIWALFATALAPDSVHMTGSTSGFSGKDEEYLERFFVPCIQRAGGLQAAMKLAAGRRE